MDLNLDAEALVSVAQAGQGSDTFPSLHAHAKCHAVICRDKRRRLKGIDLVDFHHALGAVVYCDAFFTDKSTRVVQTTSPVALDVEVGCKVFSDESDSACGASGTMCGSLIFIRSPGIRHSAASKFISAYFACRWRLRTERCAQRIVSFDVLPRVSPQASIGRRAARTSVGVIRTGSGERT
ncbi:hypothetical protein GCM10011488_23600 [Steroidobacter agaridevorans]|nr:hypothetical protein [Steroidobacter agaridevorans]GFE87406.1 hypothetical protein GCM10011488_23600 [Steroidobacter agaridevorans]